MILTLHIPWASPSQTRRWGQRRSWWVLAHTWGVLLSPCSQFDGGSGRGLVEHEGNMVNLTWASTSSQPNPWIMDRVLSSGPHSTFWAALRPPFSSAEISLTGAVGSVWGLEIQSEIRARHTCRGWGFSLGPGGAQAPVSSEDWKQPLCSRLFMDQ